MRRRRAEPLPAACRQRLLNLRPEVASGILVSRVQKGGAGFRPASARMLRVR